MNPYVLAAIANKVVFLTKALLFIGRIVLNDTETSLSDLTHVPCVLFSNCGISLWSGGVD
jgi:hypothetical protein